MYKFIISAAFLLFSLHANAQLDTAALKLKYEKEVIYFSGGKYVKDGVKYPYKQLKNEFSNSPEGLKVFKMYESDAEKSRFASNAFLGLVITGIIVDFTTQQDKLASGLVLAGIIPLGFSIHFSTRADKKMKKAVWLRNRDVLLR